MSLIISQIYEQIFKPTECKTPKVNFNLNYEFYLGDYWCLSSWDIGVSHSSQMNTLTERACHAISPAMFPTNPWIITNMILWHHHN